MKHRNKLKSIFAILILGVFALILSPPANAAAALGRAWDAPSFTLPTSLAAASTNTPSSSYISLKPNRSVGLLFTLRGTSATATNTVTHNFTVSEDGSSQTTANLFSVVLTANGTNWVRFWTNLPSTYIGGCPRLHLSTLVGGSGTGTTTNMSVRAYQMND